MKKTLLFLLIGFFSFNNNEYEINKNYDYINLTVQESIKNFKDKKSTYDKYIKNNFYNGESKKGIIKKINKQLNSTLKNKGEYIVDYSIKKNIDPYLVTAVILQETGCKWTCSYLTRVCNNVGGNKGKPGCNGSSYRKFDTIEDGIKFAINKLNTYYKKGLTTPKEIGPHYASDPLWAKRVNNYIKKLKSGE